MVDQPQQFDLAQMQYGTEHVGVFVSPDMVLHCERATGTVCVPVVRLRELLGVWRHRSRA